MSNIDLLKMSLGNLWRRRMRTMLTILGVVIGCSSIIVMLSLGFGMKKNMESQIAEMGDVDIITVVPYPKYNEKTNEEKEPAPLNNDAVKYIESLPHVSVVLPQLRVEADGIITDKYETYGQIIGVDPNAFSKIFTEITWGRNLEENDSNAAVFGGSLKDNWSNYKSRRTTNNMNRDKSPVDLEKDRIYIAAGQTFDENTNNFSFEKKFKIKVVGELPEEDWKTAYNVFVPMEYALKLNKDIKKIKDKLKSEGNVSYGEKKGRSIYTEITVKVEDIKYMRDVQDALESQNYNLHSTLRYVDAITKSINNQRKILGGIGAVSLIVAAIGIANTMVMSIYERIKEIGIMKVIGASVKDIKKLFLTEAALIGLFGGAFGVMISYAISTILNKYGKGNPDSPSFGPMGIPSEEGAAISIIPPWLIIVALLFSALIGIISGYYPARKATKLSALDAIRMN